MSTSERTMNQVRAILQRLDRSIDEAREKRTQPAPATAAHAPLAAAKPAGSAPAARSAEGNVNGSTRPVSPFGRAQPLNRGGGSTPQYRWGN
jgi:hypothetical protein